MEQIQTLLLNVEGGTLGGYTWNWNYILKLNRENFPQIQTLLLNVAPMKKGALRGDTWN